MEHIRRACLLISRSNGGINRDRSQALADHLRAIGDQNRAFLVSFGPYSQTVVATSASKAKYSYYCDVAGCYPGLTFKQFCARASVHVAERKRKPLAAADEIAF